MIRNLITLTRVAIGGYLIWLSSSGSGHFVYFLVAGILMLILPWGTSHQSVSKSLPAEPSQSFFEWMLSN